MFETNANQLLCVVRLVTNVHYRTIRRLRQLLLEGVEENVHFPLLRSFLLHDVKESLGMIASTTQKQHTTIPWMWNVHREGMLQYSEPVARITQMLNPTDLVLSIVHKTLIEFGKMRGSLHHHVGLLFVALETGDVVEGTVVVHIPFRRDVVLRISDSERERT